jgi:glycosyltransferase involved in cell wall biosynthesis
MTSKQGLRGVRVLLMTSGHKASDSRVYDKEAVSLAERGARVTVIGQEPKVRPGEDGIRLITIPKPKNKLDRFFVLPWRCWSLAKRLRFDILHIQDIELLQIVPCVRLIRPKTKVVYDVHEDFANLVAIRDYIPEALKSFLRRLIDLLEKRSVGLVHGVVGVTDPLVRRFGRVPKIATYNFPSSKFYDRAGETARRSPDRIYDIVHLGTLSSQRGEFLLETLHLVHDRRPGTRTLLTGVHEGVFRQLEHRLPVGCRMEGLIPYESVAVRLCSARVGIDIHPFPTPNLTVALPVKVFEYMACGCAVVSSELPVLKGLLGSHGDGLQEVVIIQGGTPEKYAVAILKLLKNLDRGELVGENLRTASRKFFLWDHEGDKLAGFYVRLLTSLGSPHGQA